MSIQMLVDAAEFWPRLRADIAAATDSIYVQTLSLEGDVAGQGLAEALHAAAAPDRRVLVDCFSHHVVSDRFRYAPLNLLDRGLRREIRDTATMIKGLRRAGVPVRFTNPAGPLLLKFPLRNHKKLAVVDGRVAYIGGINFSEHNFAWRDLMLRIEDETLGRVLHDDFLATWGGHNLGLSARIGDLELHLFDGRTNHQRFERIFRLIDAARERIYLECAYITAPFLERLAAAARRGVAVSVVTPEANNWGLVRELLLREAATSAMDVRFYHRRMTHMKALLVDGSALVVGSLNLDLWSFHFQQEIAAVIRDPLLLAEFDARVAAEGMRGSRPCERPAGRLRGRVAGLRLRSLESLALLVHGGSAAPAPAPRSRPQTPYAISSSRTFKRRITPFIVSRPTS